MSLQPSSQTHGRPSGTFPPPSRTSSRNKEEGRRENENPAALEEEEGGEKERNRLRRYRILSRRREAAMASAYRCVKCEADLNLSAAHLYPPGTYFEAGDKGTLSFSWADESKLRLTREDRIRPFFETVNYWGIQRRRTRLQCGACAAVVGHIYDDGPPVMQGHGQLGMGPSQVIPRAPRYRFKTKALKAAAAAAPQ